MNKQMRKKDNKITGYLMMVLLGALAAINYIMFVFPNNFAPAGVDGVCTMIQYLFHFNIGYLALIINIPLLIVGAFILNVEYTIKSTVYIISFSIVSLLPEFVDVSRFLYHTETGSSAVLAPLAGGVIRGLIYAYTIKHGGSSGGIDVIAAIIHKYKPHMNLMNIIFFQNMLVAFMAYFVYGFTIEPVICSIFYAYLASAVSNHVQAGKKESVRFEVITCEAERLCEDIMITLQQTATILPARGAYSAKEKKMVVCVTEKRNVPILEKILNNYTDAVTFESVIQNSLYHL